MKLLNNKIKIKNNKMKLLDNRIKIFGLNALEWRDNRQKILLRINSMDRYKLYNLECLSHKITD